MSVACGYPLCWRVHDTMRIHEQSLFDDSGASQSYSGIAAGQRAMAMIEPTARDRYGLSVTELSQTLRINKGLVHRVLASLTSDGYVYKDELTQRYRLTSKLLGLAFRYVRSLEMYDLVQPILR